MLPDADEPSDDFFEALMRAYTDAWNHEDVDAIASYYNVPFLRYADGRLDIYNSEVATRRELAAWIEVNRRAGPARSERLRSDFTRLGRDAILITTHWVFRRPNGSDVWDFYDTFELCRFGAQWRFLNRTRHD